MNNRARLFTLDSKGETISTKDFPWVEDAMEEASREAGEELGNWGDTQIGYEAMTKAAGDKLTETGEYPDRFWQILGLDKDGNEDEIAAEYHREEGDE
jgi:hypothetical protein